VESKEQAVGRKYSLVAVVQSFIASAEGLATCVIIVNGSIEGDLFDDVYFPE